MATRIVIIGGGPAGLRGGAGGRRPRPDVAEVTVVDCDGIGGACVLFDCVPSKTFIASTGRAHRAAPRRRAWASTSASRTPRSRCRRSTTGSRRWPASQSADIGSQLLQRGGQRRRRPRRAVDDVPGHGASPGEGHHDRRQGRRPQGRRGADRHRCQPAGAAQRGARRRAHPDLASALRPHRAARAPGHRRLRRHRRGVLQRLHRARRHGHRGGQPRPDPAARGQRRRRRAGGGVRRTRRDAGEERPRRLGGRAPTTGCG